MRFTLRRYALGAAALVSVVGLAWAADVSTGYNRDGGSYFKNTDRSGPYVIDTGGTATLLGTGSGGGTADSTAANQALQLAQETAINTVMGLKTDAKSTATDGTSITWMQVQKQISASVQLSATAANQTTANTALAAIQVATEAGATAANQASQAGLLSAIQVAVEVLSNLNYTPPTTGTLTAVSDDDSPAQNCAASNANRQGLYIFNDSTAILYVRAASGTATTTAFTQKVDAGGAFNLPVTTSGVYTGAVNCIWSADASGAARVTEWTP